MSEGKYGYDLRHKMSSFLWISCDNGSVVNASLELLKGVLISMLIWHVEFEQGLCMQKRSD